MPEHDQRFRSAERAAEQSHPHLTECSCPRDGSTTRRILLGGLARWKSNSLRLNLKSEHRDATAVTLTIQNSQVGILQTGDQANVISSKVSLTTEQKQELNVALQELCEKLDTVESMIRRPAQSCGRLR